MLIRGNDSLITLTLGMKMAMLGIIAITMILSVFYCVSGLQKRDGSAKLGLVMTLISGVLFAVLCILFWEKNNLLVSETQDSVTPSAVQSVPAESVSAPAQCLPSNKVQSIPSTLGIGLYTFKERFNEHAKESNYPQLQIGDLTIETGEEQDGASYTINANLSFTAGVNQADCSIRDATLIFQKDGSVESTIEFFLMTVYMIRAFDPELEERSQILENLGLLDSNSYSAIYNDTYTVINDTIYAMGPYPPDGYYFTMVNKNDPDFEGMNLEGNAENVQATDEMAEELMTYRLYVNGEPFADFPSKRDANNYAKMHGMTNDDVVYESLDWRDLDFDIPEIAVLVDGVERASFYSKEKAIEYAERYERSEVWVPNSTIWSNIPVLLYQEDTYIKAYDSKYDAIQDAMEMNNAKLVDQDTNKVIWDNYPRECGACDSAIQEQY